jgi:tripartite-type tricarboxylate transporter receptor subunit TctC
MTTSERISCFAAATVAALAVSDNSAAQTYPNRPVRILVPFAPGAPPDILARIIGNKLAEQIGQPVIVDPRPGGSGVIAAEIAKNATPDGYTLLLAGSTLFATLPALKAGLPYDINKDFVALSRVASVAQVLAVPASLGVGTVSDLVKLAKARPGQLNYGSAGNGSSSHLAGEMFNVLAAIKTVHVPYKASSLALNDLIAGQVQFIIPSPPVVMPHAKAGRVKVIATTGAKRDPFFPELPTVAETVPGFEFTQWWGIAAPGKTRAEIIGKLQAEITKVLSTDELRGLLAKQGATPHAESSAEFIAFIKLERDRIGRMGREVGVVLD